MFVRRDALARPRHLSGGGSCSNCDERAICRNHTAGQLCPIRGTAPCPMPDGDRRWRCSLRTNARTCCVPPARLHRQQYVARIDGLRPACRDDGFGGRTDYVSKDCAILTPKRDPRALAGTIVGLTVDRQRLVDMGPCARARAMDFCWETVAGRTVEVYDWLRNHPRQA